MIVEVDEYKEKVVGYDAQKSEDFHIESAKLADKDFIKYLKSGKYKRVILMAGGTASGKTEFATSYLTHKDQLVYDGTLKNFEGFEIKYKNIMKYTKDEAKVKIVLIMPSNFDDAFKIFHNRKRKMKDETFFDTQIRSRQTVAKILMETKVRVEIYSSIYNVDKDILIYNRINVSNRKETAKNLIKTVDYFYENLKNLLNTNI